MTFYTVYKTTNTINEKYYVGVHQTDDLDDGYLGSGKLLKSAIAKYGEEAFSKEIMAIFESAEEMFTMEGELVTSDLVIDTQCYNLKEGGQGGWNSHNSDPNYRWAREKGAAIRNAIPIKDEWREKMRDAGKARHLAGGNPNLRYDWTGKTRSEETKRKIGEANRCMVGEKNSQFGTVWVYNEEIKQSRKASADEIDELLLAGWKRGRRMKF